MLRHRAAARRATCRRAPAVSARARGTTCSTATSWRARAARPGAGDRATRHARGAAGLDRVRRGRVDAPMLAAVGPPPATRPASSSAARRRSSSTSPTRSSRLGHDRGRDPHGALRPHGRMTDDRPAPRRQRRGGRPRPVFGALEMTSAPEDCASCGQRFMLGEHRPYRCAGGCCAARAATTSR